MNKIIVCLVIIIFVASCNKDIVPEGTPSCVEKKIKDIMSEPVRNPPAKVWKTNYNNQIVYYIPSYCCDIESELYDENCTLICKPDGGFTGHGDGQCIDFSLQNEELIWEDDRSN